MQSEKEILEKYKRLEPLLKAAKELLGRAGTGFSVTEHAVSYHAALMAERISSAYEILLEAIVAQELLVTLEAEETKPPEGVKEPGYLQ